MIMSDSITNPSQPSLDVAQPTDLDAVAAEVTDGMDVDSQDDGSDLDLGDAAAIDTAVKAGEISKKEAQQLKKTLKLKVDGEDIEESIDFSDDEALKRMMQKARGFDKRAKESATMKSQLEQLVEMLQNDPEGILEKLGHNVDDFAQKRLEKQIENMKKSPEQLEREKMSKELEDLRKEKTKAESDRKNAEMEKMRNQHAQQIENDISEALDSAKSILPKKNPAVMKRVAEAMYFAATHGYPQVSAKDVLPMVEKQWQEEINSILNEAPEEVLERIVGKGNLDRYRKGKISKKKAAPATTTAKQVVKDTGSKKSEPQDQDGAKRYNKMDRFWKF